LRSKNANEPLKASSGQINFVSATL
jgi:hypothetical protein